MNTSFNALTADIRKKIAAQNGHIAFADFMQLALYHPQHGYYNRPDFTLGKTGDFTTAPEISALFAKCFAKQFQALLAQLGCRQILELGAGTGRFAGDLATALKQSGTDFSYYIYEPNKALRAKQQLLLQHHPQIHTIRWLDELPQAFEGIIFANEVLDALPVHCFRIEEDSIKERCVTWENGQFSWTLQPAGKALAKKVAEIKRRYDLYAGYESEINLGLPAFIQAIAVSLKRGVIVFADYGYGQREYYHPERNKGTLTCFYQHQYNADPLWQPGQQDITAHVDFTETAHLAEENGCAFLGFTTQAAFLLALGLMEFAEETERTCSEAEKFQLHQAIKLLTLPTEMGELVKVIAFSKNVQEVTMDGLCLQDRSRDL